MNIDLERTAVMEALKEPIVQLLIRAREIDAENPAVIPLRLHQLANNAERYAIETFLSAGEVIAVCGQLRHSAAYASQFRSTTKLKEVGVTRTSHIIYHLENHSIRVRMVFDRILQLMNVAFRLGNSKRNCTRQIILQNDYVKSSDVIHPIRKIDQILQRFNPSANIVLHQEGHTEPLLRFPELVSSLAEAGVPDVPIYAAKTQLDKFVIEKETELSQFNQALQEAVIDVLNSLGPECERRYAELRN